MLIDLSIKIDSQTPVYPGDPAIGVEQVAAVAQNGYALHTITLGSHSGTHIDAPAHMIEGGATLEAIDLDTYKGPAKLIEGFSLDAVQAAGLLPGDIALFLTGTSDRFQAVDYFTDYPAMEPTIAMYLIEIGVKMVGLDTCSADNRDDFPVHKLLLGAGIPIIENLTGLSRLRDKQCSLIALPLRLDADAAPARVIAEVA
jgi:arylformamidase